TSAKPSTSPVPPMYASLAHRCRTVTAVNAFLAVVGVPSSATAMFSLQAGFVVLFARMRGNPAPRGRRRPGGVLLRCVGDDAVRIENAYGDDPGRSRRILIVKAPAATNG
ncbi:MAG: hypothetical protein M3499_03335, partial [Actinomycetota bacterium]|nr:hypothetical protein [Actinomycetota bacterium]